MYHIIFILFGIVCIIRMQGFFTELVGSVIAAHITLFKEGI